MAIGDNPLITSLTESRNEFDVAKGQSDATDFLNGLRTVEIYSLPIC